MKINREWFIDVPWGKIAMISWGTPKGHPVLLVHGRLDSVATFTPLLDRLPEDFNFVAFDLPGHGKSDAFPVSVMLTRLHFIHPLALVVKSLGWRKFTYLGHSMGGEIGLFFGALYPDRITKYVLLDVGMAFQKITPVSYGMFYSVYEHYYNNYANINHSKKVYTKESAIQSVVNARGLPPDLAELVLTRNLVPYETVESINEDDEEARLLVNESFIIADADKWTLHQKHRERSTPLIIDTPTDPDLKDESDQKYTLVFDQRLKNLAHANLSFEQYVHICTNNMPPILFFAAKDSILKYSEQFAEKLINEMRQIPSFKYVEVDGNHDVHLLHPDLLCEDIIPFLLVEMLAAKL